MYNVFQQSSNIYAPCIYIQMWRWASDISWSHLKWQYPVNEPKCFFFFFFFFFFLLGLGEVLDYFLFQLLSELCFPTCTWSLALSKVCFKFSDQASMNYQYPHVASVRLSSLFPYTAITEIRDASTVALCYTGSPMTDTHTQELRLIHLSQNNHTLECLPHLPPPAFIPLLPTLAQFSNVVCQVVHASP